MEAEYALEDEDVGAVHGHRPLLAAVRHEVVDRHVNLLSLPQSLQEENYTVETAYKVYVCPRGNLLYMRIYLIIDLKLLWRGVLGLKCIYFIGDFTLNQLL